MCCDKNEIIRILLFHTYTIDSSNKWYFELFFIILNSLLEKITDGSYIKKLEIHKPFYGCLIFGGFNWIVYKNENNL